MALFKKRQKSERSASEKPRSMQTQQYYKGKTQPKPQIDNKKKSPWLLYVTLICIFLGFIYSVVISPDASLSVNSEVYRAKSAYLNKVNQLLAEPLNRNKLTINTKQIEQALKVEFPEITSTSFSIPLIGQTPSVGIKVVDPVLVLNNGSDKFIIDKQGRAVVKNPTQDVSGLVKLTDQSGFEVKLGQQVLTTEEVSFISYLNKQAKQKSLDIKEFVLPSATPAELYMYQNNKSYFVKFFMGGSADIQLGSYLAIEPELKAQSIAPEQYVDVRVEERVFVK